MHRLLLVGVSLVAASHAPQRDVRVYFEYPDFPDLQYKEVAIVNEAHIYLPTPVPTFKEYSDRQPLPAHSLPMTGLTAEETVAVCEQFVASIDDQVTEMRGRLWGECVRMEHRSALWQLEFAKSIKSAVDSHCDKLSTLDTTQLYRWLFHRRIRAYLWPTVHAYHLFEGVPESALKDHSGLAMSVMDLRAQLEQVAQRVRDKANRQHRIPNPFNLGPSVILAIQFGAVPPDKDSLVKSLLRTITEASSADTANMFRSMCKMERELLSNHGSGYLVLSVSLLTVGSSGGGGGEVVVGRAVTEDIVKMVCNERHYFSVFKTYEWLRYQLMQIGMRAPTCYLPIAEGMAPVESVNWPPPKHALSSPPLPVTAFRVAAHDRPRRRQLAKLLAFTLSVPLERLLSWFQASTIPIGVMTVAVVHVYPSWSLYRLEGMAAEGRRARALRERVAAYLRRCDDDNYASSSECTGDAGAADADDDGSDISCPG